jgi:hypothetical protein
MTKGSLRSASAGETQVEGQQARDGRVAPTRHRLNNPQRLVIDVEGGDLAGRTGPALAQSFDPTGE